MTQNILRASAVALVLSAGLASGARAEGDVGKLAVDAAKAAVVHNVVRNFEGAKRESGTVDQIVRAALGISMKDIRQYGIWGGPNSFFRKPFG